MCDHTNDPGGREAAMVVLDPGTPERQGRDGVWCDPCLVPLIRALNAGGISTVASCCGHGRITGSIILRDDQHLIIMTRQEADAYYATLPPEGINGPNEADAPALGSPEWDAMVRENMRPIAASGVTVEEFAENAQALSRAMLDAPATQPDPDGGVDMTDSEWSALRGEVSLSNALRYIAGEQPVLAGWDLRALAVRVGALEQDRDQWRDSAQYAVRQVERVRALVVRSEYGGDPRVEDLRAIVGGAQ